MVQSEVTPTIVAGVCDPGDPTTTGLTEAGYNACPVVARAEAPECYPKTGVFEPCLFERDSISDALYTFDKSPGCLKQFKGLKRRNDKVRNAPLQGVIT